MKEKPKKKKAAEILRITLFSLAGVLLIIIGASAYFYNFVLTPEKLTAIVKQVADDTVDADVELGKVYLTVFASFPRLVVAVDSGTVVSRHNVVDSTRLEARGRYFASRRDSSAHPRRKFDERRILGFKKAYIDINPFQYLFNDKIKADRISLIRPEFYYTVYADSTTNFDILKHREEVSDSETSEIPEMDVKLLSVTEGRMHYRDLTSQTSVFLRDFDVELSVKNVDDEALLRGRATVSRFSMQLFGYRFERNRDLSFDIDGRYDKKERVLTLEKGSIGINGVKVSADGTVRSAGNRKTDVDIDLSMESPTLEKLIAFVPRGVLDENIKIDSEGRIDINGKLHGFYGNGIYPVYTSSVRMNRVRARYGEMPLGIDELSLEADMVIDLNDEGRSYLNLNRLVLEAGEKSVRVNATGAVNDFIDDPSVIADLKGEIDFGKLHMIFPINDSITLAGKGRFDIESQFEVRNLVDGKYNLIALKGNADCKDIDFVQYSGPTLRDSTDMTNIIEVGKLDLAVDNGGVGSRSVISAIAENSYINLEKYAEMRIKGLNVAFSGMNTPEGNYEELKVGAEAEKLRYRDKDKKFFKIENAVLKGSGSSNSDTPVPNLDMDVIAENMSFAIPDTVYASAEKAMLKVGVIPQHDSRRRAALDIKGSLADLGIKSRVTGTDVSVSKTDFTAGLITPRKGDNRWNYEGTGNIEALTGRTEMFPIDVRIPRSYFTYNTRKVTLTRTSFYLGESYFITSGTVQGMIGRLLFDRGFMSGTVTLVSKKLNLNELIAAANNLTEEELMSDSVPSSMLVLPDYMKLKLKTDLQNVSLFDIELDRVSGTIEVGKKTAVLDPLQIKLLGSEMSLYAKYKAFDSVRAKIGLEARIKNMGLEKLTGLMPSLRTMFPMAESVKGSVNLDMVASGDLYGDYHFDLNTLNAVLRFRGSDLVLMDGDTFAKVSKILMFKNKKENIIPELDINIVAGEGKAVIKPTKIDIDRYEFIAGGTQWFDMRCDYNISVLKSPLPFKAGVDIVKKDKDLKIGIGKAALKKTNFGDVAKQVGADYDKLLDSIKN